MKTLSSPSANIFTSKYSYIYQEVKDFSIDSAGEKANDLEGVKEGAKNGLKNLSNSVEDKNLSLKEKEGNLNKLESKVNKLKQEIQKVEKTEWETPKNIKNKGWRRINDAKNQNLADINREALVKMSDATGEEDRLSIDLTYLEKELSTLKTAIRLWESFEKK